jgi:hypothetical protein
MGQASLDTFLMDSFEGAVQEVQSLADRCKVYQPLTHTADARNAT